MKKALTCKRKPCMLKVIWLQENEPTYKELQQLLRATPSSNSSKPLAERLQAEFKFNRDSIK